jgi:hypothetical protein
MHLQELRFQNTPLAFDFLCPLNGEGQPDMNGILDWPSLKILEIEGIPEWLPSGEYLFSVAHDST